MAHHDYLMVLWISQAHIASAVSIQSSMLPFPLNSGTTENKCLVLVKRNPALRPYFALGWLFMMDEVPVCWSDSSDYGVSGTVQCLLVHECL